MIQKEHNTIVYFLVGILIFINLYYLGKVLVVLTELVSFKYELFWNNIMITRICVYLLILLGVAYLIFRIGPIIIVNKTKHILFLSIIPILLYVSQLILKNIYGNKYILSTSIEYLSKIESANILIDAIFKIVMFFMLVISVFILNSKNEV